MSISFVIVKKNVRSFIEFPSRLRITVWPQCGETEVGTPSFSFSFSGFFGVVISCSLLVLYELERDSVLFLPSV